MSLNLAALLRSSARQRATAPAMTIGAMTLDYATLDGMARRFGGALSRLGM